MGHGYRPQPAQRAMGDRSRGRRGNAPEKRPVRQKPCLRETPAYSPEFSKSVKQGEGDDCRERHLEYREIWGFESIGVAAFTSLNDKADIWLMHKTRKGQLDGEGAA